MSLGIYEEKKTVVADRPAYENGTKLLIIALFCFVLLNRY